VNPDHLEPVTAAENTRREMAAIKAAGGHKRRSHCRRGHPMVGANVKLDSRGRRACRRCANAKRRAQWAGRPTCKNGHVYAQQKTTPGRHRRCYVCRPME
jgi:hypothetical protein